MYFLFCGVCRLAVRWIFSLKWYLFTTKKDGSTGPSALESDGPYFENLGQWPKPTINLKACFSLQLIIEKDACFVFRFKKKNLNIPSMTCKVNEIWMITDYFQNQVIYGICHCSHLWLFIKIGLKIITKEKEKFASRNFMFSMCVVKVLFNFIF